MKALTKIEKEACKIAASSLKWHPQYIAEFCQCEASGNLTKEEIANQYIQDWEKKSAYRLYEPFTVINGYRISDVDLSEDRLPDPVDQWDGDIQIAPKYCAIR